jgi:adenylate cyclase
VVPLSATKRKYQLWGIGIFIAAITVFHYQAIGGHLGLHIFHRELYFIPIIIAAYLFGLKIGLITALIISAVYAPHVFMYQDPHGSLLTVGSQVFVFILVAVILGWMVDRQRKNEFIQETFGKYVSREVRDEILSGRISLRGDLQKATVMSVDISNFNLLVETLPPWDVIEILNEYFREMAAAVQSHGGVVLQSFSDEMQIVFGLPMDTGDHRLQAVKASLEMKNRLNLLNSRLKQKNDVALYHDIGIHSGIVLAANIGSPNRLSYGIIGKTVTTALKVRMVNNNSQEAGILVSEETAKGLIDEIPLRKIQTGLTNNLGDTMAVYEVVDREIPE